MHNLRDNILTLKIEENKSLRYQIANYMGLGRTVLSIGIILVGGELAGGLNAPDDKVAGIVFLLIPSTLLLMVFLFGLIMMHIFSITVYIRTHIEEPIDKLLDGTYREWINEVCPPEVERKEPVIGFEKWASKNPATGKHWIGIGSFIVILIITIGVWLAIQSFEAAHWPDFAINSRIIFGLLVTVPVGLMFFIVWCVRRYWTKNVDLKPHSTKLGNERPWWKRLFGRK